MKRMAENPVTNELREFMKDHTGRHVFAHRVDIDTLRPLLMLDERNQSDAVTFKKSKEEIEGLIQGRVGRRLPKLEKHNDFEFSLVQLKPQIEELEKSVARLEADLKSPYSDKDPTNKALKTVRAQLRTLRTQERHLREDIQETAGIRNHVPVADETS